MISGFGIIPGIPADPAASVILLRKKLVCETIIGTGCIFLQQFGYMIYLKHYNNLVMNELVTKHEANIGSGIRKWLVAFGEDIVQNP
jgi:hypothetical protein